MEASRNVDDLLATEGRRVEHDGRLDEPGRVDRGGEGVEGGAGHGRRPALDLGQLRFGLLGYPADRRPGEDVVELVGEQEPPGGLQLDGHPGGGAGRGGPQLGRLEGRLALAVAPLDGGLAGEGTPVLLQVEVADPHR